MCIKIVPVFTTCCALLWLLPACKKQYPSSSSLLQDARTFFTSNPLAPPQNYRAGIPKTVLWDQARVVSLSIGDGVFVPVRYQAGLFVKSTFGCDRLVSLNYLTQLLLYRDSHHTFHAVLVTTLPDSNYLSNPLGIFTGFRFVEDWNGNPVAKYLYKPDGTILKLGVSHIQTDATITVCNVITGYNYAPSTNDTEEWTETAGCTEMYFPDDIGEGEPGGGDYGGGGGGSGAPPAMMILHAGKNPIPNIAQYIQCFQNNGNLSSYTITLYVDQPLPGTRKPFTVGTQSKNGTFDIGHVFVDFEEASPSETIVRSMGYYPKNWVSPASPINPGSLNNDQNHIFNISLKISVSGQQFMQILDAFASGNSVNYNLNSNNCTTWALTALEAGGIKIQANQGTWPLGKGYDPGDLGEDIRDMPLPLNMSRNEQGGTSPPNSGACQ
jgi:hypothetical protein